MALTLKEVAGEIGYVESLYVFRIKALVHRLAHLTKSLSKKVSGSLVLEGAKLGHACPYYSGTPEKLRSFVHIRLSLFLPF
jgi:hypothetical protein